MPGSAFNGCEKCECDEIGTDPSSLQGENYVCNRTTSQCACKPHRIGLKCETCGAGKICTKGFFLSSKKI